MKKPGSKKGKRSTSAAKNQTEKPKSKYPPIEINQRIEDIKINIRLLGPKTDSSYYDITVPINYTIQKVADIINEKHNCSCKNLRLFDQTKENNLENILYKTFQQLNLRNELTIYYDFDPIIHPLLEASNNII
jgi:hypothetical protein